MRFKFEKTAIMSSQILPKKFIWGNKKNAEFYADPKLFKMVWKSSVA